MQTLSQTVIRAASAASEQTSATIAGQLLSSLSLQAVVAGGSGIVGVLYVDGSNEETPVNWYSPVGASISVSGNVSTGTVALGICYRWVRARWVPSAGTGGTISVAMMAQSGPSPMGPYANGLIETSGPTPLLMGAWADGLYARRSGDTIIGAAAGVPVQAARLSFGAVTDVYYTQQGILTVTSALTPGIGTIRSRHIVFGRDGTVSSLGVTVQTGGANAKGRVGIWLAGANGYPTTLVGESGELDLSTTGRKVATGLSFPVSAALAYWVGFLGGTLAATLSVMNDAVSFGSFATAAGTTTTRAIGLSVAQAYGAMPAAFPAGGVTTGTGTQIPVMLVGVS